MIHSCQSQNYSKNPQRFRILRINQRVWTISQEPTFARSHIIHKYMISLIYKHTHSGRQRSEWQTASVTPQAFINVEQASLVGGMTLFQIITINLEYRNTTRHSLMLADNLLLLRLYRCESGPVNAHWHVHFTMKKAAEQTRFVTESENRRDAH